MVAKVSKCVRFRAIRERPFYSLPSILGFHTARVKMGRASSSQTCPLLPQLQKSGTTSHTAVHIRGTSKRFFLRTSDGPEALDDFSTICKAHLLFDHLI